MAADRLHRGIDARDLADAHAWPCSPDRGFRPFVFSVHTPFMHDDVDELLRDAPSVPGRRAPDPVETIARREWPLPASIDRVYVPVLARQQPGWRPRYGFEEGVGMADEGSSEVIAP